MKKRQYERFASCLFTFSFLAMLFFHSGCIVAILGTPSAYEKKIPAEYDLAKHRNQKLLVLVNQPGWLNAQVNLRYYLTTAIHQNLITKVKISPEYLVPYSELSEFRSNKSGFSLLSPVEVGKALDAGMVLFVGIENYQLQKIAETNYYKGFLSARTVLLDTATGGKLWPKSAKSKSIRVGFEVESGGQEAAAKRLASACAHCITRYLYDCLKHKFKIPDDRSGIGWENWETGRISRAGTLQARHTK